MRSLTVRYTLLRLLIFLGVLLVLSLVPALRDNTVLLLGLSVVLSAAVSFVVLRGMREEIAGRIESWDEARREARAVDGEPQPGSDELAEDAEADRRDDTPGP